MQLKRQLQPPRMLVLVVSDKNERPAPESGVAPTDEQSASLFRTMVSYGGTYDFDGHTVKHHIDFSWNQAWTGTTQIRDVQKDGDKLIYTTRPAPSLVDGKMSVVTSFGKNSIDCRRPVRVKKRELACGAGQPKSMTWPQSPRWLLQ
jgi:hypothetical protein